MRATPQGMGCALAAFVALAAALTSLGIMADLMADLPARASFTWWQITVVSCASVASAAGLLVIAFEVMRGARSCACFAGPRSTAGVLFCLVGFAAHCGMLVSFTVYLAKYFSGGLSSAWGSSASIYTSSYMYSCVRDRNAFDCFGDWPTRWQAMYIFGCAIGLLFWVLALVLALLDLGASKRRQVFDTPSKQGAPIVVDEFMQGVQRAPPPRVVMV